MSEKPHVQLTGGDGNVFTILGKVQRALRDADQPEKAEEFFRRATTEGRNYDGVLALTFEYVDPT